MTVAELERMVRAGMPGVRIVGAERLRGGLRNTNYIVRLEGRPEALVLRVYGNDASLCRKEADLLALVADAVPAPEGVYVGAEESEELQCQFSRTDAERRRGRSRSSVAIRWGSAGGDRAIPIRESRLVGTGTAGDSSATRGERPCATIRRSLPGVGDRGPKNNCLEW